MIVQEKIVPQAASAVAGLLLSQPKPGATRRSVLLLVARLLMSRCVFLGEIERRVAENTVITLTTSHMPV